MARSTGVTPSVRFHAASACPPTASCTWARSPAGCRRTDTTLMRPRRRSSHEKPDHFHSGRPRTRAHGCCAVDERGGGPARRAGTYRLVLEGNRTRVEAAGRNATGRSATETSGAFVDATCGRRRTVEADRSGNPHAARRGGRAADKPEGRTSTSNPSRRRAVPPRSDRRDQQPHVDDPGTPHDLG